MADNSPMTPDELRGLLTPQAPQKSSPSTAQEPASGAMTPDELRGMLVAPDGSSAGKPAPERVGFLEDLGRTAVAKGTQGVAALPGMFGDIASLVGGENKYLPTTSDIMKSIKGISPGVEKALDYKPEYGANKYLGSAIEFLPGALIPGGQIGLGARAAGAVGAGLASQGAESYLKGTPSEGTGYQTAAQIAAALAGGMGGTGLAKGIGSTVKGSIAPESEALKRMAKAQGSDETVGGAKGARADVLGGTSPNDILPAAAGGQNMQALLSKSAGSAGEAAQGKFNAVAERFKDEAIPKVQRAIDDAFGGKEVQAFEAMDTYAQRVKELNDTNYKRVMALPEAAFIQSPDINAIMGRLPKGTMDNVLDSFRMRDVDPASYGLLKTNKGWVVPPGGANLRFFDEIKQQLDDSIGRLMDPVTKTIKPGERSAVGDLMGIKTKLTNILDTKVPEYKQIRSEAADIYGAKNALEAGYKYFSDNSPKRMHIFEQKLSKMTDAQKDELAYGFASAFKDSLNKGTQNPAKMLGVYGGKASEQTINKFRTALGDERANSLLGTVNSEYLNSGVKTLFASDPGVLSGVGKLGLASGIASEAAMIGGNVIQGLSFSMSGASILAALAAGAGKAAYNWKERRIGEKVLELAANPETNQRLGKLIAENQDARSFLAKTYTNMSRIAPAYGVEPPPERPARASGGRINSESKADQLILMAERAKRGIGKSTAMLLDTPDDHVAHALAIANKHI